MAAQRAHNLIGRHVKKDDPHKIRRQEIERVRVALLHAQWPRLQMMIIVSLTGATGFVASVALLHSHVDALWLRYPLAVAAAYLMFLFQLWCWLRLRGDHVFDGVDAPASGTGTSGSPLVSEAAGALSEGTAGFELDLGEAAVLLIVLAALLAGAWFTIGVVWIAPDLFAELVLAAVLAGGLYRRLRAIHADHWLRTAARLTAWRFAAVAIVFCVAGFAIQLHSPGAKSIGQAFHGSKHGQ